MKNFKTLFIIACLLNTITISAQFDTTAIVHTVVGAGLSVVGHTVIPGLDNSILVGIITTVIMGLWHWIHVKRIKSGK